MSRTSLDVHAATRTSDVTSTSAPTATCALLIGTALRVRTTNAPSVIWMATRTMSSPAGRASTRTPRWSVPDVARRHDCGQRSDQRAKAVREVRRDRGIPVATVRVRRRQAESPESPGRRRYVASSRRAEFAVDERGRRDREAAEQAIVTDGLAEAPGRITRPPAGRREERNTDRQTEKYLREARMADGDRSWQEKADGQATENSLKDDDRQRDDPSRRSQPRVPPPATARSPE